jgi:predicted RNA methylase
MAVLANIQPNDIILEPSAGQGAIVDAIHRVSSEVTVYCCELMPENVVILDKKKFVVMLGNDFLDGGTEFKPVFNKILMNPPFSGHQDIEHVQKAYSLLKDGGRLVAIMSGHAFSASHKVDKEFRNWLDDLGGTVTDIEAGTFKESGTMVGAKLVVLDK